MPPGIIGAGGKESLHRGALRGAGGACANERRRAGLRMARLRTGWIGDHNGLEALAEPVHLDAGMVQVFVGHGRQNCRQRAFVGLSDWT